ncbi:MAG: thioesterase family protein [archaeon]|nr:thioesterase family protein [archaeon]
MISVGISGEKKLLVTDKDTAEAWGSGTLPVLATPKMILLVEETASAAVADDLPEGDTTVGTLVDIKHVSASPVGTEVTCRVEVIEVDRARIRFQVSVTDRFGDVGTGVHERFVVHSDKFMAKANTKLQ